MNKYHLMVFTITLLLFQTAGNSELIISFSELGFNVQLNGVGSIYREARITIGKVSNVIVEWKIFYHKGSEGEAKLTIGVNESSLKFQLVSGNEIVERIELKREVKTLVVWVNLTSLGAVVSLDPNSEIIIKSEGEQSAKNTILMGIYIALYVVPLTLLAMRRFERRSLTNKEVISDEE